MGSALSGRFYRHRVALVRWTNQDLGTNSTFHELASTEKCVVDGSFIRQTMTTLAPFTARKMRRQLLQFLHSGPSFPPPPPKGIYFILSSFRFFLLEDFPRKKFYSSLHGSPLFLRP